MAVFCCCTVPRPSKTRSLASREQQPVLPTPPPPVRLPGPLSLNPVTPVSDGSSSKSPSSPQPSIPTAIIPIEPVELGLLVVEDSDSDEDLEPGTHSKSTSTLQLVRTHIRQHLSQDSLTRRKARSAVGSSLEEIERRAELKRLMHKRIQEELHSEEGQDNAQNNKLSGHCRNGPSIDTLPGGGPRDNLEFSVAEDTTGFETQCISSIDSDLSTSQDADVSSDSLAASQGDERRVASPGCNTNAEDQDIITDRSSILQMPLSPDLRPKRAPSPHDASSLGSWRLSYGADQLEEFLGYADGGLISQGDKPAQKPPSSPEPKEDGELSDHRAPTAGHTHSLSRSHSSPARQGTPVNENAPVINQSPLSTWLRSQGLRSRTPSASGAGTSMQDCDHDGSVKEAEVVYLRRCSSVQHCAVPENDIPRPEIVHLYDMDIHRQLATTAFNTPAVSSSRPNSRNPGSREGSKEHSSSATNNRLSEVSEGSARHHAKKPIAGSTRVSNRKSSSMHPSITDGMGQSPEQLFNHDGERTSGQRVPLSPVLGFRCMSPPPLTAIA